MATGERGAATFSHSRLSTLVQKLKAGQYTAKTGKVRMKPLPLRRPKLRTQIYATTFHLREKALNSKETPK